MDGSPSSEIMYRFDSEPRFVWSRDPSRASACRRRFPSNAVASLRILYVLWRTKSSAEKINTDNTRQRL